jgi:hypothetical protein
MSINANAILITAGVKMTNSDPPIGSEATAYPAAFTDGDRAEDKQLQLGLTDKALHDSTVAQYSMLTISNPNSTSVFVKINSTTLAPLLPGTPTVPFRCSYLTGAGITFFANAVTTCNIGVSFVNVTPNPAT